MQNIPKCIFTVDVEDWFHILDVPTAPDICSWSTLASRVETSFERLLDIFSEAQKNVTCFFVGWVAERFPHLVREAVARGHEIASHGYAHRLAFSMTREEFRDDALRSRLLLEDISGTRVVGYRAPGFSSTEDVPWFFNELCATGYIYDSSVFPAPHGHGGRPNSPLFPHLVEEESLVELPASVAELGPMRMCFFGGGYLRLFPYSVIRSMGKRVMAKGRPLVFYIHPREIDPGHPRLPMSPMRRFKCYVNLQTTEQKIRNIMRDFPITTCRDVLFGTNSEIPCSAAESAVLPPQFADDHSTSTTVQITPGYPSRVA
jgi:polysaccharide deacetylase family protein (PEP-CTERM system associated)